MDAQTFEGLYMVALAVAAPCALFVLYIAIFECGSSEEQRRERGERRWRNRRGR